MVPESNDTQEAGGAGSAVKLLSERYNTLSAGHRSIADFILGSPHEAALMTQEQVSAAAGVSAATANRLGRRLGLSGYPEFQELLRLELRAALRPIENFADSIQGLADGAPWTDSLRQDIERIRLIAPSGGDAAFARASALLAGARRVFFLGFGSSAFIAQYGAFCLSTIRTGSEALADSSGLEGLQRKVLDAGVEDACVVIGFARYSKPAIQAARQLAAAGVPLICITDAEASPFARLSSLRFIVSRKSGFVLTGSGAGAMSVLEALLRGSAAAIGPDLVGRRAAKLTSMLGPTVLLSDEEQRDSF